ncbi:hypothetical protein ACHQM5_019403 [Ranunculus cassubicifolius]
MKKTKLNSQDTEVVVVVVDIISNLPEAIRNYIVSFLPMDDAIRTSILSKPWRNVCSSLSNLDFDQQLFEEMSSKKTGFKETICQLIDHRDGSNVQSFKLSIDVVDDSIVPYIHLWISYVVKHNVRELRLLVRSGNLASLPCSLFTSTTLTVLCLSDIGLELPSVVVFPLLKMLDLQRIKWSDENETNQLISNCPLLETLVLIHCSWNTINLLIVSAPNLKRLRFEVATFVQHQEVNISSASLCECAYIGQPPYISSECLSSLVIAKLYFFPYKDGFKESPSVMNHCVFKILMGLQNVVQLTLGLPTLEEPGEVAFLLNMEAHHQPQNLSDMRALKHIAIGGLKGNDNELYLVRHLLENAKPLVVMMINYSKDLDEDESMRNVIGDKIKKFAKASPNAMIAFV